MCAMKIRPLSFTSALLLRPISRTLLLGKSSLLNAICGEERSIVCNMSGTTRDAVDTEVTLPGGQKLLLVDTAGIRKRTKVGRGCWNHTTREWV